MNERIINAHHLEKGGSVRDLLWKVHDIHETTDLNHVNLAITGALEGLHESGLHKRNFEKVFEQIQKHEDWKLLHESQQTRVKAALEKHLGIKEEEAV